MFAGELARRLRNAGSSVTSIVANPGMTTTPMHGHLHSPAERLMMHTMSALLARPVDEGARNVLYAMAAEHVPELALIGPSRRKTDQRIHFSPLTTAALDELTAAKLWATSEDLTGRAFGAAP
jgi:hypothetical protein